MVCSLLSKYREDSKDFLKMKFRLGISLWGGVAKLEYGLGLREIHKGKFIKRSEAIVSIMMGRNSTVDRGWSKPCGEWLGMMRMRLQASGSICWIRIGITLVIVLKINGLEVNERSSAINPVLYPSPRRVGDSPIKLRSVFVFVANSLQKFNDYFDAITMPRSQINAPEIVIPVPFPAF